MEFKVWWRDRFGTALPLGHLLRGCIPDWWFRIHSLPESKRWPAETAEYEELLRRHNAIASEVLGVDSRCWLAVITYVDSPAEIEDAAIPDLPGLSPGKWSRPIFFQEPEDPCIENSISLVACQAIEVEWAPGRFDDLIRLVADDKAPQLLFAEQGRARIYAPYDGGADLFLESSEHRDRIRGRYSNWLSSHPLGL
jgi:hypothetical protein